MDEVGRLRLSIFALALMASASCAGAAAQGPARPTSPSTPPAVNATASRAAHPADVQFVSGMIHHHAQALVMADLALTHAASPGVRTLAERIRVSQTDEIRFMQQWLGQKGEPVPEPSPEGMPSAAAGQTHHTLMPGMLTRPEMDALAAARGEEFDRLFLTYMIRHHEGALDMVDALFGTDGAGQDDIVYKLASDTFADQGAEIDRMQRMLDALSAGR